MHCDDVHKLATDAQEVGVQFAEDMVAEPKPVGKSMLFQRFAFA